MVKLGLLLDEGPNKKINFGGVTTWNLNFLEMFRNHDTYEVISIYCFDDNNLDFNNKNIRYVHKNKLNKINIVFKDIDIVINCLWSTNKILKCINKPIVTVIHSLLYKEYLTNAQTTCDTSAFQETTFSLSDHILFVSNCEREYFLEKYPDLKVPTSVIYNTYIPKYTHRPYKHLDTVGYIGRFVPRKRPELAILGLNKIDRLDIECLLMGKHDNIYWEKLSKKYKNITLVKESFNEEEKNIFFDKVGIGSFTSIYEPFGYSLCEFIDRGIPVIVADIDGPKEIIHGFRECVYPYKVFFDYEKDQKSYAKTLKYVLSLSKEERKENSKKARKILDSFKPEIILKDWEKLFKNIY